MKSFWNFLIVFILFCFLFPVESFCEKRVAVILSNQHVRYEEIYENFKSSPDIKNIIIKKYVLDNRNNSDYLKDAIKGGNFDAAFAIGTNATKMMKDIATVPTVFSMVVNPKYFGFIGKDEASLPNLCGISIEVPVEEQFKLLKKIIPRIQRIGVIYDPSKSGYTIARAIKTSQRLGLEVYEVPVKSSPEVPQALSKLEGTIEVLFAIVDDTVYRSSTMGHILLRCLKRKTPVFGFSHTITKAGAIFSTYIDFDSIGKVAAERIKMLLDGTTCEEIPFKFTNKWRYSLNLAVAERLNIEISHNIIVNADKIVNQ
ncbi:MAG: hypothetical protein KAI43_05055 [Candidatus Aureabacteria bacterium]|nr:hypothetical protein [Candidatus Auribacterota bacterium]